MPKPIQDAIIKDGIEAALDLTYKLTEPFTPQYFYDEMQGMADGFVVVVVVVVVVLMKKCVKYVLKECF